MLRLAGALVSIVAVMASATPVRAADEPAGGELRQAERDVEIAQLRLRRYETFEYPQQLRKLDSQIKLAEPEVDIWRRRVKEYAMLDRFVDSGFMITIEEARQSLLVAETNLDDLRDERHRLQNQHVDECRLLELELEVVCERLEALRGAAPAVQSIQKRGERALPVRVSHASPRATSSSKAAAKAP